MLQKMIFRAVMAIISIQGLSAQNDCRVIYDQEAIYLRTEMLKGNRFVKEGRSMSLGLFFKNLEPEFDNTPKARVFFQEAKKNSKLGLGANLLGVVAGVTGILLLNDYSNTGDNKKLKAGTALILGGATFALAFAAPLTIKSQRQLSDALFLRTRELFE